MFEQLLLAMQIANNRKTFRLKLSIALSRQQIVYKKFLKDLTFLIADDHRREFLLSENKAWPWKSGMKINKEMLHSANCRDNILGESDDKRRLPAEFLSRGRKKWRSHSRIFNRTRTFELEDWKCKRIRKTTLISENCRMSQTVSENLTIQLRRSWNCFHEVIG